MDVGAAKEPVCAGNQVMDESLEFIFLSIIRQDDVLEALDFVRFLDVDIMPSKTVLRTIIFEILMKNENERALALSYDYLMTVLSQFPPNNEEMRSHYYDSIRDTHGYLEDLWTVFTHIVNSFLYHRSIYQLEDGRSRTEPIKYPNCKFLLQFYVKLFSIDFEYLYVKSFQPCLVMLLLWQGNKIFLSNRTDTLLQWINDLYSSSFVNTMGDLLLSLHEMLTLMVKCFLQAKYRLSEQSAFSHPCLSEIVEATVNFCRSVYASHENLKLFLASLSLKCFQAKVSDRIIKQITRQVSKRTCVLTLNDIVYQCMYPQKSNKWKNPKPLSVNTDKNLRKRVLPKARKTGAAASDSKIDTTRIHELVRKNKFGDLYQALQESPEDINARDKDGCTPLHEACKTGSYCSVNVLITESKKDHIPNLNYTATNLEGSTALHLAVEANSVEVVKLLLSAGGSDLLNVTNNKGFKPSDWSSSEEMTKLFKEYQTETSSNEPDLTTESSILKEVPNLKTYKDFSIYLHALVCLLGTYCQLFNVYDFQWKRNDIVKSHEDKQCVHYLEEDVCSEDASIASQLPHLVATFIETIDNNAKKIGLNIDVELIPLKGFAASMRAS